jgi:hypothetical protein
VPLVDHVRRKHVRALPRRAFELRVGDGKLSYIHFESPARVRVRTIAPQVHLVRQRDRMNGVGLCYLPNADASVR